MSTQDPTHQANVILCRAIEGQPILYDLNNDFYRKRLPTENCWDMVSSELGVPVEKIKRRWRQIRNDYVRWTTSDEIRSRNGQKRPTFYLAEELKFLQPHLFSGGNNNSERDKESLERDSKSKSRESSIDASYKGKQKDDSGSVDDQQQESNKLNSTEAEEEEEQEEAERNKSAQTDKDGDEQMNDSASISKPKEKANDESKDNSPHIDDKETSESFATPTITSTAPATPASGKATEFFIKQSDQSGSNCLIIGKKPAERMSLTPTHPVRDQNGDDSDDETQSVGGGRVRRGRGRPRIKPLSPAPIEQRLTRLQRRKSLSIAVANSLRSSTSPLKMTPLPRATVLAATVQGKAQAKVHPKPAQKIAIARTRDDIFPRPRPVPSTQMMLSRRSAGVSGQQQKPQQQQPQQQQPQQQQPAQKLQQQQMQQPAQKLQHQQLQQQQPLQKLQQQQKHLQHSSMAPPVISQVRPQYPIGISSRSATSMAPAIRGYNSLANSRAQTPTQLQPQQRLVSTSNTLVISTTSSPISSVNASIMSTLSSNSTSIGGSTTQTASITATPVVSSTAPGLKRCERGNQTETQDLYSDDYFLDMLRPQMREMNPRQKMHFKQKIFQSLMDIFDDATDFPTSGEVQHFNINTPSGFENITDSELRLVRELVSMVSAAKHTEEIATPTAAALKQTKPKSVVRVLRPSAAVAATAPTGSSMVDDKKLYRLVATKFGSSSNASTSPSPDKRKDSDDSCGSSTVSPFALPSHSSKVARTQDPLSLLFERQSGTPVKKPTANAELVPVVPNQQLLVRQMGRRYSICGAGGGRNAVNAQASMVALPKAAMDHLLAKRQASSANPFAPPPQRPRYAQSSLMPGNSLLVRRNRGQNLPSPTGGSSGPQKSPQMGNYNAFATPNAIRAPSPLKRGLVVANVKGSMHSRSSLSPMRTLLANRSPTPGPSNSSNVANLLGDKTLHARTTPPAHTASPQNGDKNASETAGIIAADDFDVGRLKREPQDIMDEQADDILGM